MFPSKVSRRRTARGFTLLEILIAIAVFSVLSMSAYQVLQGVISADETSSRHTKRLKELQRSMLLIERDMQQIAARTVRQDGESDKSLLRTGKFVAESDADGLGFVRLGWTNPINQLPRSNLVRVAYRLKDENLERLYFLYPDVVTGVEPQVQVLITDVEDLKFRYWNKGWGDSWKNKKQLPKGIAIELKLKDFGEIRRLFLIPQGGLAKNEEQQPAS